MDLILIGLLSAAVTTLALLTTHLATKLHRLRERQNIVENKLTHLATRHLHLTTILANHMGVDIHIIRLRTTDKE